MRGNRTAKTQANVNMKDIVIRKESRVSLMENKLTAVVFVAGVSALHERLTSVENLGCVLPDGVGLM